MIKESTWLYYRTFQSRLCPCVFSPTTSFHVAGGLATFSSLPRSLCPTALAAFSSGSIATNASLSLRTKTRSHDIFHGGPVLVSRALFRWPATVRTGFWTSSASSWWNCPYHIPKIQTRLGYSAICSPGCTSGPKRTR